MGVKKIIVFFKVRFERFLLLKAMNSTNRMNLFCRVFRYKVKYNKTMHGIVVEDLLSPGMKIIIGSMSRSHLYLNGIKTRLGKLASEYMVDSMLLQDRDVIFDVGANVGELGMFFNEEISSWGGGVPCI